MYCQPELTDAEWGLVLELLDTERRNLPTEIRRTDTPRVHDELQERMKVIDDLMTRVRRGMQVTA